MLHLTLLDGKTIRLNPDSLLLVESTPDTLVKLTNGEFFLVTNAIEEVEQQFIAYKQRLAQSPTFKTLG